MKFNKDEKKEILLEMQKLLREEKYKGGLGGAYKMQDDLFLKVSYDITPINKLYIWTSVKKCFYDEFFWDIMNMSDNRNEGVAFRARGAFVSPTVTVEWTLLDFPEDENEYDFFKRNLKSALEKLDDFIASNDLNYYILDKIDVQNGGTLADGDLLKCLAYCDLGDIEKAKQVAQRELQNGNEGGFENEGKNFFEWMLLYDPVEKAQS